MNDIYKNVQTAVRSQIIKYIGTLTDEIKPNQIVGENINKNLPNYPFITLDIVDDDNPIGYSTDTDVFQMDIQLKVVSENENKAKSIGRWLRKLLFLKQPFQDLCQQGIAPQAQPRALPSGMSPIINDYQFSAGAVITLQVLDPIEDISQSGVLQVVNEDYKRKDD